MKVLIIRLSSAGDVLLTTPVVRCVKQQLSDVEIHFLTKSSNAELLRNNPYVDKLIEVNVNSIESTIQNLKSEHYDYVVDLHNNHRSRRIRRALGFSDFRIFGFSGFRTRRLSVYRKENLHKFLFVITKKNVMSGRHVVERYLAAVRHLGVVDDGGGLDFFGLSDSQTFGLSDCQINGLSDNSRYVAIACGAQHTTKQIPADKIKYLCDNLHCTVVLLGDKNDERRLADANVLGFSDCPNVINLCGKTTLTDLAAVVKNAVAIVTPDSLTLHLAAAFQRPAVAVWGATSPSFGFSSFRAPHHDFVATGLRCHPCSRMGSDKCPRGHFSCMQRQDWQSVVDLVNEANPQTFGLPDFRTI